MIKPTEILATKDYTMFKQLEGNRPVDEKHVKMLMQSMSEDQCIAPIQINEKNMIIDGQHRAEALKRLKKPIYYYIVRGADLTTVQRLNTHTQNWDNEDFLGSWITKGLKDYQWYKEFADTYKFTHKVNLMLLVGSSGYNQQDVEKFQKGEFKVKSMKEACDLANQLARMEPHYKGFKRRSFIAALVKAIKTKGFDFERFIGKMQFQSRKLVDCSNETQYLELIEEIYNYKNRGEHKLALRKL